MVEITYGIIIDVYIPISETIIYLRCGVTANIARFHPFNGSGQPRVQLPALEYLFFPFSPYGKHVFLLSCYTISFLG
jgi:hypothetical protein